MKFTECSNHWNSKKKAKCCLRNENPHCTTPSLLRSMSWSAIPGIVTSDHILLAAIQAETGIAAFQFVYRKAEVRAAWPHEMTTSMRKYFIYRFMNSSIRSLQCSRQSHQQYIILCSKWLSYFSENFRAIGYINRLSYVVQHCSFLRTTKETYKSWHQNHCKN